MLLVDDLDVQRADLGVHLRLVEGLDGVAVSRGEDDVIPGRPGRLYRPPLADIRRLVLEGVFTDGAAATRGATMRAYVDQAKRLLAPDRKTLLRLLVSVEDGSFRWIYCVARNWIVDQHIPELLKVSIELEAKDPYWYGPWGVITLDSGLFLDDGYFLDQSGEVVVHPTSSSYLVDVDTLGSADVTRIAVKFTGPSTGGVGLEATTEEGVTYGFSSLVVLNSGGVLEVDNWNRTSIRDGGASRRGSMTLRDENINGEYIRLGPGPNILRILGKPAEARITFLPTYQ